MRIRKEFLIVLFVLTGVFAFTFYEPTPVQRLMDWRASVNTRSNHQVSLSDYQVYDHSNGDEPYLTVDFLKGKHFWNPQLAIWLEDSSGNFLETLLVTTSTARGLFYAGRSAANFKESDEVKTENNAPTRRVDALPYWSHRRNLRYSDGYYSPPPSEPLPDAITGATPKENFYFKSPANAIESLESFRIMVEVNVAFDDNEYYSEYDFPEDSLYHSGTGLLGQPSLIYATSISRKDAQRYYLLHLMGHGHHSGATGELFPDTGTVTTAKYVVERIVVGINEAWYK